MYKKVLVPVEPGHVERHEMALRMAKALCEDASSEIIAITVIEPVPGYFATAEGLPEMQSQAARQTMADLAGILGEDVTIHSKVMHGHPATEINSYAEQNGVDCIVIASHKPGLVDYLLGSTAARVVRHAPCSVHVIR